MFTAIGTTYGTGDGSTTFILPDYRGRNPIGLDDMGGSDAGRLNVTNTLGGSGGEQLHTLTEAELAAHTHPGATMSIAVRQNIGETATNPGTTLSGSGFQTSYSSALSNWQGSSNVRFHW